jgi:hypothetical protein
MQFVGLDEAPDAAEMYFVLPEVVEHPTMNFAKWKPRL